MVSVIIPNYNRSDLVCNAVRSVLNQTYDNIEVVVVDDGSTDDSIVKLKQINDKRLRVISLENNSGACVARNAGIDAARGDFISFLDSDDEWVSNKLELQIKFLENNAVDACFCAYYFIGIGGSKEIRPKSKNISNSTSLFEELLVRNYITTGAILAKAKVFVNCRFDEKLPRYQDWDIALQIAKKFSFGYLNAPLFIMNEQKNSITNSTSIYKKRTALEYLYSKYSSDIMRNEKAKAQFLWSIAMYRLVENSRDTNCLQEAFYADSNNKKKCVVYIMAKFGLGGIVAKLYRRGH